MTFVINLDFIQIVFGNFFGTPFFKWSHLHHKTNLLRFRYKTVVSVNYLNTVNNMNFKNRTQHRWLPNRQWPIRANFVRGWRLRDDVEDRGGWNLWPRVEPRSDILRKSKSSAPRPASLEEQRPTKSWINLELNYVVITSKCSSEIKIRSSKLTIWERVKVRKSRSMCHSQNYFNFFSHFEWGLVGSAKLNTSPFLTLTLIRHEHFFVVKWHFFEEKL